MNDDADIPTPSGDDLLRALSALASPHRLGIIAALVNGRVHVSGLARQVGISRPLTHMHLQRLEAAGLVQGTLELSADGRAMKYFEVVPFVITLTPQIVASASETITADADSAAGSSQEVQE